MLEPDWTPLGGPLDRVPSPPLLPSLLVTASAAVLISGCGSPGDITAKMAPAARVDAADDPAGSQAALVAPMDPGPSNMAVSPRQREYLDALTAAGVQRLTDLRALEIGSYVCQGRAAGQNDQAVWDFVFPLVRGEVDGFTGNVHPHDTTAPPLMSASDATVAYIHLATERLC